MFKKIFIIATLVFCQSALLADDNCKDDNVFSTTAQKCGCILNNGVNDCLHNSPIRTVCNKNALNDFFQKDPQLAQVNCERYRDKSLPDQCPWAVNFYVQNKCWALNAG